MSLQFRHIFETHFDGLVDFATSYLHNRPAAEDIVQQVFVKLWENRERLLQEENLKYYLYRSVKNRCFNHVRDHKKQSDELLNDEDLFRTEPDVLDRIDEKELSRQIDGWINELPPACKRVFVLSRKEQMSHKEISSLLDISTKTVENQITKALKYLRSKIN